MAGEERFSLFGSPTPGEIRDRIGKSLFEESLAFGQVDPSMLPIVGINQSLGLLSRELAGPTEEEIKARKRSVIEGRLQMMKDFDIAKDPVGSLKLVADEFRKEGLMEDALQASLLARQLELENLDVTSKAAKNIAAAKSGKGSKPEIVKLMDTLRETKDPKERKFLLARINKLATNPETVETVLVPLFKKMLAGEKLDKGEKNTLSLIKSNDALKALLFNRMFDTIVEDINSISETQESSKEKKSSLKGKIKIRRVE